MPETAIGAGLAASSCRVISRSASLDSAPLVQATLAGVRISSCSRRGARVPARLRADVEGRVRASRDFPPGGAGAGRSATAAPQQLGVIRLGLS
jgi:hypothetical protein